MQFLVATEKCLFPEQYSLKMSHFQQKGFIRVYNCSVYLCSWINKSRKQPNKSENSKSIIGLFWVWVIQGTTNFDLVVLKMLKALLIFSWLLINIWRCTIFWIFGNLIKIVLGILYILYRFVFKLNMFF